MLILLVLCSLKKLGHLPTCSHPRSRLAPLSPQSPYPPPHDLQVFWTAASTKMATMKSRISIMSEWHRSLSENDGVAWVNCRTPGEKTIEGELRSHGVNDQGTPEVTVSEGFTVSDVTKRKITVACPGKNVSAQIVAPSTSLESIHDKSIHSLDISAGGALGVSASSDGHLRVWETSTGIIRRELEGHAGEVETCRFFPSGLVVLSGGLDTQLKIWSVEDGSCPVTLTGHKRGIQDTAIVDRGRNIISCSLDGSARLWDCGQSQCLGVIGEGSDAINGCAVAPVCDGVDLGTPANPTSDREVATDGRLLLLAREGGSLEGYGLRSRQKVFSMSGSSPFNCCTFLSSQTMAGGADDGNIYLLDIRNTSEPQSIIHQSASPVKCMLGYQDGFIASTNDGGCFYFNLKNGFLQEFTGSDFDPVYSMALHQNHLYTACRDHVIRKYNL